jgi:hypothetical protein
MECNVGGVDRVVRILVGVLLTGLAIFFFPSAITKTVLLVIAASALGTAWFGFCFINKMLGINTANPKTAPSELARR